MPHFPEPFYRSARKAWFLQLGKRQIKLAADEKEARRRYHEIMAAQEEETPSPALRTDLAVVVVDTFLDWVKAHKAPRTFEWYQRHLQVFADAVPRSLLVAQLRPFHVTRIADAHPEWSANNKHGFCRSVQRAFRWAERQGHIERSPLAAVEKPEPEAKDVVVSPEEYQRVLTLARGRFRELLEMAWESGMRPQELRLVEARHLDTERGRFVFPPKDAKGKKLPRVVYLTDEALQIAARLAEGYPEGAIFRNADGVAWTRYAINCAFIRLQKKLGRKLHLGAFRKSFATEAIKNGVDPVTAAHLLGHRNTNMLASVYARVAQDPEYLRRQAKKATGGNGCASSGG